MAQSLIPKTPLVIVRNSRSGFSAGFGGKIGVPIDRTGLISEIVLKLTASAAFAVAPTGVDPRYFISRITVRSSDGDIVAALSGFQIYDFAKLTEKQSVPKLTPGAGAGAVGTCVYNQEIHLEMDGAYFDLMTAIKGEEISKLDLTIEVADSAHCLAGFVGATFAAAPAFSLTADVEVYSHPAMSNRSDNGIGKQVQYLTSKELPGTTIGRNTIELDPSCLMRGILLNVQNTTAAVGVPSDAIVTNVILKQGGEVLRETDFAAMRLYTEAHTELGNVPGSAVLWWGDAETGWAALNASPVQLQFDTVLPAGVTNWSVAVSQNYKRDRSHRATEK